MSESKLLARETKSKNVCFCKATRWLLFAAPRRGAATHRAASAGSLCC
jgi:hypothetical protein